MSCIYIHDFCNSYRNLFIFIYLIKKNLYCFHNCFYSMMNNNNCLSALDDISIQYISALFSAGFYHLQPAVIFFFCTTCDNFKVFFLFWIKKERGQDFFFRSTFFFLIHEIIPFYFNSASLLQHTHTQK